MPDYTVTVTRSKVVQEDIPVTAANEAAAEAAAVVIAKTYVLEKEVGTVTFTADATAV